MKTYTDKQILDQNFFVISSDNFNSIKDSFYGYAFVDNKLFINYYPHKSNLPVDSVGVFINIKREKNKIYIQQDILGLYKLYIYEYNNYYAISNSFYNLYKYLVENNKFFSINKNYLYYYVCDETYSIQETLINEISLVANNQIIEIDTKNNRISRENINLLNSRIDINSPQGIEILDNWYYKWSNFIAYLIETKNDVWVSLSGGFDTRAVFSLFISNDIDLNKVTVYSIPGNLHTLSDDYRIASKISTIYDFKLNNINNKKYINISDKLSIELENYTRFGSHCEVNFSSSYYINRRYFFGGSGGGNIKKLNNDLDEFIKSRFNRNIFYSFDCIDSIKNIINSSIQYIYKNYSNFIKNEHDVLSFLYLKTRNRIHNGSSIVKNLILNSFEFSPLMDPVLLKLNMFIEQNSDKNLIYSIIYDRYCNSIKDLEFDTNKSIDKNTSFLAQKINNLFPKEKFFQNKNKYKFEIYENSNKYIPQISNDPTLKSCRILSNLYNILYSNSVKQDIIKILTPEIYNYAKNLIHKKKYHPETLCYKLLTIISIFRSCNYLKAYNGKYLNSIISNNLFSTNFTYDKSDNFNIFLNNRNFFNGVLDNLFIARIDIKNFGSDFYGEIKNIQTDFNNVSISKPLWFTNKSGKGIVITSKEGILDISFICKTEGTLQCFFRGIDYRINNERFPLMITYNSIKINNINIINNSTQAWHDKPVKYLTSCKKDELFKIHIEWEPHNYNDKDLLNVIKTLLCYPPTKRLVGNNIFTGDKIFLSYIFRNKHIYKIFDIYNIFNTAYIYIRNQGHDEFGDIKFNCCENKTNYQIKNSNIFTNKLGKGYVLCSKIAKINIEIKCINDGILFFNFSCFDFTNKYKEHLKIIYKIIEINGINILSDATIACHDNPIQFTLPVKNGDPIILNIYFQPYDFSNSEYINFIEKFLTY